MHRRSRRRRHRCHRHRRQPRGPTTDTEGIELVAVTVAVTFGDVGTSALVISPGPLQTPQASSAPTQSSTSSQIHRHRRQPRRTHHRHRGHRAGCRHSHGHLRGCRHIRTRDLSGPVADPAGVQCTDAVVDVVTDAIGIGVSRAGPTTDTEGVSRCRHSRSHLRGCGTSALVISPGPLQTPQASRHRRSRRRRHRCHRHRRQPHRTHHRHRGHRAGCRRSRGHLRGCYGAAALASLRGPSTAQTPQASRAPTQSSTSSQIYPASASAAQDPPRTPRASSWLPSRSQSPSGMSAHPHCRSLRARCRPRRRPCTDAVVDVVTDAIGIGVSRAGPTTDTEGVELVAVTVAVTFGDVGAAALVHLSGPVADPV